MTDLWERQLREVLTEDAARAPVVPGLYEQALRRVRRRRARLGVAVASLAVLVAAVGGLGAVLLRGQPDRAATVAPPAAAPRGALRGAVAASCVEGYSTTTLAARAFAFDGTVTAIDPVDAGTTQRWVMVGFRVNEWFRGGSGPSVRIEMTPPQNLAAMSEFVPSYRVGSRLLVSGEPRWGGAPLTDPVAWGCGFTRYYDPATAGTWHRIFG